MKNLEADTFKLDGYTSGPINKLNKKEVAILSEYHIIKHWTYLPQILGFKVCYLPQATIIHGGLIVCDLQLDSNKMGVDGVADPEQLLAAIEDHLQGKPFEWWVGPSSTPANLGDILMKYGLSKTTNEAIMVYWPNDTINKEIATPPPPIPATIDSIVMAQHHRELDDFIAVLEPYSHNARYFYEQISLKQATNEQFFIGYEKEDPVVIANTYQHGAIGGIFNLLTKKDKRGMGYATTMVKRLIRNEGSIHQTPIQMWCLSTSNPAAQRLYGRLGFQTV